MQVIFEAGDDLESGIDFKLKIQRVLDNLFGWEKLLFVEYFLEEFTTREISMRYKNMSESTIKRRLRKIRSKSIIKELAV